MPHLKQIGRKAIVNSKDSIIEMDENIRRKQHDDLIAIFGYLDQNTKGETARIGILKTYLCLFILLYAYEHDLRERDNLQELFYCIDRFASDKDFNHMDYIKSYNTEQIYNEFIELEDKEKSLLAFFKSIIKIELEELYYFGDF